MGIAANFASRASIRELQMPADMATHDMETGSPWRSWTDAMVLLVLVLVLLAGTGTYVVRQQESVLDAARFRQFSIVGKSKSALTRQWIDERQRDVRVLLENPGFIASLARWMGEGAHGEALREALIHDVEAVVEANGFDGTVVVSTDGKVSLGVPDNLTARKACREAARSESPAATDEIRVSRAFLGPGDTPKLDVIGKVFETVNGGQRHVATLCMRVDLTQRLLPAMSKWPGSSRSGEVLMGRIDGDDVIVLNGQSTVATGGRSWRISNGAATWRSALQATERQDVLEQQDAAGVNKVILAHPIDGTPWILMVRMNREEADQRQSRTQTYASIAIGFLLLFLVAAFASSARERVQMHRD